jgi:heat shock protein HtpX/STE24 endopeptidase
MGFGRPLANALRRVMDTPAAHTSRWERLWYSHPPARLRVVRIEALLRRRAR